MRICYHGTTEAKYSLNSSSFSRKALSVSLKMIPFSSNSFPYYDIQLLIHIEQKHLLNIFVTSGIPNLSNVRLISSGTSSHER